jgi:TolB protein
LYVMPVAGGAMLRLPTNISRFCAEPDWSTVSPNKIAFTANIGGAYQIAVYDMNKRSSVQASHAAFDGIEPSWLGDGRHVLYTARDRVTSRICILDTETGKSVVVSPSSLGAVKQASVVMPMPGWPPTPNTSRARSVR